VSDRDLDAEFARIIAGWDDEAPDPQARDRDAVDPDASAAAPAAPDPAATASPVVKADEADPPPAPPDAEPAQPQLPRDAGGTDPTAPPQPGTSAPAASGSSGRLELPIAPTTSHAWRGSTTRGDDAEDVVDDGDHFVPPSEIDLPSAETDPMFWAIVGGLAGGPLLLLYVLFFDRDGSGWWVVTALTMVVVGFVLLVLRGGTERDPFDDGTRI